jgi:hypothetical protein
MRLDNVGRVERLRRTDVGLPGAMELLMLRLEETVLSEYRDETDPLRGWDPPEGLH